MTEATLAPEVQLLKDGFNRRQIFQAPYWEASGLPMTWNEADLFEVDKAEIELLPGSTGSDGAHAAARIRFGSGVSIDIRWSLSAVSNALRLVAIQRCAALERAFSIDWPLRVETFSQAVMADTGGGLVDMATGHIPTSSIRWQSVQSGIALVGEGDTALVVHSPDAPLFQPEGPWTREPHVPLTGASGGSFWSVNTHWDTNFPSHVYDPAPFRLVLRRTPLGEAAAALRRLATPPVIVRTPCAEEGPVEGFWTDAPQAPATGPEPPDRQASSRS